MGAAEDAYRRRQEAAEAERLRKKRESEERALIDIQRYLPRAVANLRRLDYPTQRLQIRMITWNREERVAWELSSMQSNSDPDFAIRSDPGTFMLADGTLIIEEVNRELRLARDWRDLSQVERVASGLRKLASLEESNWSRLRLVFIRPQLKL